MAPDQSRSKANRIRLLLDQGFPKPPGFALNTVDATVDAIHLSDFDQELSNNPTPDWYVYCRAVEGGFDALVTRDLKQTKQAPEMFVLSRLKRFAVICWRQPVEDSLAEWGQLIAYLPQIKKRLDDLTRSTIILLPKPSLSEKSLHDPTGFLGEISNDRKSSGAQVRHEAEEEIVEWLTETGEVERFSEMLRIVRTEV